jgi:hypothetical protein
MGLRKLITDIKKSTTKILKIAIEKTIGQLFNLITQNPKVAESQQITRFKQFVNSCISDNASFKDILGRESIVNRMMTNYNTNANDFTDKIIEVYNSLNETRFYNILAAELTKN